MASTDHPPLESQTKFWNQWNTSLRAQDEPDTFMSRQLAIALRSAKRLERDDATILEIGCGTGWMSRRLSEYGRVTAIDLSADAIALARSRDPSIEFMAGDFLQLDLEGAFDLIVSADVIGHVYDHREFARRTAALARPGATFLLMSQNPYVWNRVSFLAPQGEGQIRDWPSLATIRKLLEPSFSITRVTSIMPAGDRGAIFWVDFTQKVTRRIVGKDRVWKVLRPLEALRLGRELVVEAQRR